jgi:hypothetical protein
VEVSGERKVPVNLADGRGDEVKSMSLIKYHVIKAYKGGKAFLHPFLTSIL